MVVRVVIVVVVVVVVVVVLVVVVFKFKICKSVKFVHRRTFQINQPNGCNSFSSLFLDVYVQLNMFRASSRPSSGAQQLQ